MVGLDHAFADYVVAPIDAVLFFDLAFWDNGQANEITLPAVVVWLIAGAIFFTLALRIHQLSRISSRHRVRPRALHRPE